MARETSKAKKKRRAQLLESRYTTHELLRIAQGNCGDLLLRKEREEGRRGGRFFMFGKALEGRERGVDSAEWLVMTCMLLQSIAAACRIWKSSRKSD